MSVCTKTAAMSSPMTTFATDLKFDFSDEVGSEESITAFAVVLNYFQLKYATDSGYDSEEVGQVGVRLIPVQTGAAQIHVTVQLMLNDGQGAAGSEDQDVSGRECLAIASVIAEIGSRPAADGTLQLLNGYDVVTASPQPVDVGSNDQNLVFMSGFGAMFGGVDEVNALSMTASGTPDAGSLTLGAKVDLMGHSQAGTWSGDVGVVSFLGSSFSWLKLVSATASIGSVSGTSGSTGTFGISDIAYPSGYTQIAYALPLIDSFKISFGSGDAHHVAELTAGINGGPGFPGGSTFPTQDTSLSWSVHTNLWGERNWDTWTMSSSSLGGQVLLVFSP